MIYPNRKTESGDNVVCILYSTSHKIHTEREGKRGSRVHQRKGKRFPVHLQYHASENLLQYKLDPTPEPSDEDIESSDDEEDGFGNKKKEEEEEDPAASNSCHDDDI